MHVTNQNGVRHRDHQDQLHHTHEWTAKLVAVLDESTLLGAIVEPLNNAPQVREMQH